MMFSYHLGARLSEASYNSGVSNKDMTSLFATFILEGAINISPINLVGELSANVQGLILKAGRIISVV